MAAVVGVILNLALVFRLPRTVAERFSQVVRVGIGAYRLGAVNCLVPFQDKRHPRDCRLRAIGFLLKTFIL